MNSSVTGLTCPLPSSRKHLSGFCREAALLPGVACFAFAISLLIVGQARAATIQLGAINVTNGASFSVPLVIDSGASPLGEYVIKVNYDPNLLHFTGITGGSGGFSSPPVINTSTNDIFPPDPGNLNTNFIGSVKYIHQQITSLTAPTGRTLVSQLNFTATGTNGTSTQLAVSELEIADTDGNPLTINPINGFVSVGIFAPGDLNGSSTFSIGDVVLLNRVILNKIAPNDPALVGGIASADLNQNGSPTIGDLVILNRTVLGTIHNQTTRILPSSRSDGTAQSAIVYGLGFTSNTITGASIGAPVGLTLTNVQPNGVSQISVVIPAGGGSGTGVVSVAATPAGATNFAKFANP